MDNEFDYLIIGGGSAGCALAGRLSEDPDTRVCLLEAGGKGDGLLVNVPAGAVAMLAKPVNLIVRSSVRASCPTSRRQRPGFRKGSIPSMIKTRATASASSVQRS